MDGSWALWEGDSKQHTVHRVCRSTTCRWIRAHLGFGKNGGSPNQRKTKTR